MRCTRVFKTMTMSCIVTYGDNPPCIVEGGSRIPNPCNTNNTHVFLAKRWEKGLNFVLLVLLGGPPAVLLMSRALILGFVAARERLGWRRHPHRRPHASVPVAEAAHDMVVGPCITVFQTMTMSCSTMQDFIDAHKVFFKICALDAHKRFLNNANQTMADADLGERAAAVARQAHERAGEEHGRGATPQRCRAGDEHAAAVPVVATAPAATMSVPFTPCCVARLTPVPRARYSVYII